jgi:hypothetical protein
MYASTVQQHKGSWNVVKLFSFKINKVNTIFADFAKVVGYLSFPLSVVKGSGTILLGANWQHRGLSVATKGDLQRGKVSQPSSFSENKGHK